LVLIIWCTCIQCEGVAVLLQISSLDEEIVGHAGETPGSVSGGIESPSGAVVEGNLETESVVGGKVVSIGASVAEGIGENEGAIHIVLGAVLDGGGIIISNTHSGDIQFSGGTFHAGGSIHFIGDVAVE